MRSRCVIDGDQDASARRPPHAPVVTVSDLLAGIARDWPAERLTLGELIEALGPRGFGVLIVLFALPNLQPFYVPGLSTLSGLPLLIVCGQLALGLTTPRLPRLLTRASMSTARLGRGIEAARPWTRWIERFVRPRPSALTSQFGDRVVGICGVWLSAIIILPTPLTSTPPAFALVALAMGLMEEDTVAIAAGAVAGIAASVLSLSIVGGLGWAVAASLDQWIGSP